MSDKFGFYPSANGFVRYTDSSVESANVAADVRANSSVIFIDYQEDYANIVTSVNALTSMIGNLVVQVQIHNNTANAVASDVDAIRLKMVDLDGIRVQGSYDAATNAFLDRTMAELGIIDTITKYVRAPIFPAFANANSIIS